MENNPEEYARILEEAADGFESGRWGWHKGGFSNRRSDLWRDATAFCMVGGIAKAANLNPYLNSLQLHGICEVLEAKIGRTVPNFNDHHAQDVSEVIDALKETAKDLRNGTIGLRWD